MERCSIVMCSGNIVLLGCSMAEVPSAWAKLQDKGEVPVEMLFGFPLKEFSKEDFEESLWGILVANRDRLIPVGEAAVLLKGLKILSA